MHVLFLGPLPPPVTGQSLACEVFLRALEEVATVDVVNHAKDSMNAGVSSFGRMLAVARWAAATRRQARKADVVYLTISQSVAGNLKDMLFYLAIGRKLGRTVVHLHGGAGMARLMRGPLGPINRWILRRVAAVIVLGKRHLLIFEGIPADRLHVVPNFAEDALFAPDPVIAAKGAAQRPLRVLALGNFIDGKGQKELVEAFRALGPDERPRFRLDFAGRFETAEDERAFRSSIEAFPEIAVHGVVHGDIKRDLLWNAHVFSMATYYRYEGQPIAILEAYAAGCAVITTDHGGIFDIFTPGENGLSVVPRSAEDLARALRALANDPDAVGRMGGRNAAVAREEYRVARYCDRLLSIITAVAAPACARDGLPPKTRRDVTENGGL